MTKQIVHTLGDGRRVTLTKNNWFRAAWLYFRFSDDPFVGKSMRLLLGWFLAADCTVAVGELFDDLAAAILTVIPGLDVVLSPLIAGMLADDAAWVPEGIGGALAIVLMVLFGAFAKVRPYRWTPHR